MSAYISRFNPYTMDDETILAVATGRKQPLRMVLDDLEDMLQGNGETSHLLVHGPRGIGKSFFARYLQIHFQKSEMFKNCRLVLFPEEQSNIQFPSDFVQMLLSQTQQGGKFEQVFTKWKEAESDWKDAYGQLRRWIDEQRERHGKFLLVALVENMDELMQRFKGGAEGKFREMLEKLPCFVLIGATPKADFDRDYNKPLFHAFKKYKLNRWKEEDFLKYFTRRRQVEEARTGVSFSPERIGLMEAKLKAISLFTGGSPRMAAVLSNLLLKDDLFSTANTLRGLIDDLTPYYQDLTKSLPPQSRKLFDTLIRAGENLSQTELAGKLATNQSEISKAFSWLQENDYIRGEKRAGSPSFRYLVNDRIYCLYYKTREVYHDQDYSPIWLLADLLVAYYEGDELRRKAMGHLEERFDADTKALAEVSLFTRGVPRDLLPQGGDKEYWMGLMKEEKTSGAAVKIAEPVLKKIEALAELEKEEEMLVQLKPLLGEACKFLEKKEIGERIASRLEEIAGMFSVKQFCNTSLEVLGKALSFRKLESNIQLQAANLGLMGWNLKDIGRYEDALEAHNQSLNLFEKENNHLALASNLSQIGYNLDQLGRHEEAIDAYRQASALEKAEGNRVEEAWNLGQIGTSLEALGRIEEAVESHRQALALEGDTSKQIAHLVLIGNCLEKLERHGEALEVHRQALKLEIEVGNVIGKANLLGQIAWNLQNIGRFEEAIDTFTQSLALFKGEGNRNTQAKIFGRIGWNLCELKRHEEAINAHRESLILWEKEGEYQEQAWNLGRIGLNLQELGRLEEAISTYRRALTLLKGEDNHLLHVWNLGQIGNNLLLLGRSKEAWNLIFETTLPKEQVFAQFGDAIKFKQEKESLATAFALTNDLLQRLKASEDKFDLTVCLIYFFTRLRSNKIQEPLLRDIYEEALVIFPSPQHQTIIKATLATVEYVAGGKQKAYLEKLPPDTAAVVEAIVREGEL